MKRNLVIKASAGTGKTFAIATQYIRLLIFGTGKVKPETILGLTFSRAAAQEIYGKILGRLCAAASSDKGAAAEKSFLLAGLDGEEKAVAEKLDYSPSAFATILRRVIDSQGHGAIATIDSFIQRIVQKFPLETGFQKTLSVLDVFGEKSSIDAAIAEVASAAGGEETILDVFASQQGDAVRSVMQRLVELASGSKAWLPFMRDHPEARGWTAESMAVALGISRKPTKPDLSTICVGEKEKEFLGKIKDLVDAFDGSGKIFPRREGEILKHFFENRDTTSYEFTHGRGANSQYCFDCGREGAEALRAAARYMAEVALNRRLDASAAKLRLCAAIESRYDAAVRRNGLLTFSDFSDCLARSGDGADPAGRPMDPEPWLLNLQFRLDSEFAHWALDEFQDTSAAQWKCLKPLVEAAIEDGAGGGNRSVLAVGDLKQSIYRWRGGCNKPFEELESKVAANMGAIETLARSYRYGKVAADFVNKVFAPSNVKALADGSCAEAVEKWEKECWPTNGHKSENEGDFVEVVSVDRKAGGGDGEEDDDGDSAPSAAMRSLAPAICSLVRTMWEKHEADCEAAKRSGKRYRADEIGILVRRNGDGIYLAERLRRIETASGVNIPVVWEGASGVLDSPVVRAILGLIELAEHPGDKFAWVAANDIFPLRETVFPRIESASAVSAAVARLLSKQGLARTVERFASALKRGKCALDERTLMRIDQLVRESAKYEERIDTGGVAGFRKYLETVSDRETASSPDVVRILTIHRSKGLTLDHTIVPITSLDDMRKPPSRSMLSGDGWVVERVGEELARILETTSAAFDAAADGHMLDELCTWYVALTRAVKSMHVLFTEESEDNGQFCNLLRRPFAEDAPADNDAGEGEREGEEGVKRPKLVYQAGAEPSFATFLEGESDEEGAPMQKPLEWKHSGKREGIRHATPSTAMAVHCGKEPIWVSSLFKETDGREDASQRGIEEHAAFAAIEWIAPGAPKDERERKILEWGGAWREAFIQTPGATVWREKNYELLAGDKWETGQFDRVVFRTAEGGRKAEIFDFKTNSRRIGESAEEFGHRMAETYAGQMQAYRAAIAKLTQMEERGISATLLLTATGTAVACN